MQRHRLRDQGWSGTVFVLVRAFDLLNLQPQMRIFVDPARLDSNALRFTTDKWEVRTVELN